MRFNPPPNWPAPPEGWHPPAGWEPDPSWGPVRQGWQLWVADPETQAPSPLRHSRLGLWVGPGALGLAAAALTFAPFLPKARVSGYPDLHVEAESFSFKENGYVGLFGALLLVLAVVIVLKRMPLGVAIAAFAISIVATVVSIYTIFNLDSDAGQPLRPDYSPGAGILPCGAVVDSCGSCVNLVPGKGGFSHKDFARRSFHSAADLAATDWRWCRFRSNSEQPVPGWVLVNVATLTDSLRLAVR